MAIEVRGLLPVSGSLYVVSGNTVYRTTSTKQRITVGTIGTSGTTVWMATDGNYVVIVDNYKGYYTQYGSIVLSEISFPGAFAPTSLTFQDGYFITAEIGTGKFYLSGSYDPTTWSATDYATAEGLYDTLMCVHSHNRDLWLFGSASTEIWYNSGDAGFPFTRYQGGYLSFGCVASRSVASNDEYVFWLDDDRRVRMGQGVQAKVISTPQIDYQISLVSNLDQSIGFCYTYKGHSYYQMTVGNPALAASKTFVYDVTTGYWHTRASGVNDDRHPAQCYAYFAGYHLVGHYSTGKILYFDDDAYTNDGETFRSIRAAQTVHSERARIFHGSFELEFESGVGNAYCADPQASLDWSDDGGHTWSTPQSKSIGASAQYSKRVRWNRLGNARQRVYRVTVDDPVKRVIISANLDGQKAK